MTKAYDTFELIGPLNEFERKHAPEKLYLEGDISLLTEGIRVSVVGSRKASEEGRFLQGFGLTGQ